MSVNTSFDNFAREMANLSQSGPEGAQKVKLAYKNLETKNRGTLDRAINGKSVTHKEAAALQKNIDIVVQKLTGGTLTAPKTSFPEKALKEFQKFAYKLSGGRVGGLSSAGIEKAVLKKFPGWKEGVKPSQEGETKTPEKLIGAQRPEGKKQVGTEAERGAAPAKPRPKSFGGFETSRTKEARKSWDSTRGAEALKGKDTIKKMNLKPSHEPLTLSEPVEEEVGKRELTHQEWVAVLKKDGSKLADAPDNYQANKDRVLDAIKSFAGAIESANEHLQKDLDFVLEAMHVNPDVFNHLSEEMQHKVLNAPTHGAPSEHISLEDLENQMREQDKKEI